MIKILQKEKIIQDIYENNKAKDYHICHECTNVIYLKSEPQKMIDHIIEKHKEMMLGCFFGDVESFPREELEEILNNIFGGETIWKFEFGHQIYLGDKKITMILKKDAEQKDKWEGRGQLIIIQNGDEETRIYNSLESAETVYDKTLKARMNKGYQVDRSQWWSTKLQKFVNIPPTKEKGIKQT